MNQTNNSTWKETVSSPWDAYYEKMGEISSENQSVTIGFSACQFALLCFIVWREYSTTTETRSFKKHVFNQVNILIFCLITSNMCFSIFNRLCFDLSINGYAEAITYGTFNTFFYTFFQFLLMYYLWVRNFFIVKTVAKWSLPFLRTIVVIYVLIQASLFIMYFLEPFVSLDVSNAVWTVIPSVTIASEIVLCSVDTFTVVIFIIFLRRAKTENILQRVDLIKYSMVAQYGIASFFCVQILLASNVGVTEVFAPDTPIISIEVYSALYYVELFTPLLYIFIQLLMKWSIHSTRQKIRSGSKFTSSKPESRKQKDPSTLRQSQTKSSVPA
ncbi:hypothetical protein BC830DRAFT_454657 [Chytriomyces sp. MP71]|nr:hypothetical protein BC830DRAFT_454657 [Chytriomyces sp. MP71]